MVKREIRTQPSWGEGGSSTRAQPPSWGEGGTAVSLAGAEVQQESSSSGVIRTRVAPAGGLAAPARLGMPMRVRNRVKAAKKHMDVFTEV